MSDTGTIMWVLTILLLVGFILTYKNLNGERVLTNSKYEGLVISVLALAASVYIGANTTKEGMSALKGLYA